MSYLRTTSRAAEPKVDAEPLFRGQHGLATRRQLLAAGLDDEAIRRQLRAHHWQRLLPGLYADTTGVVTPDQRRVAATLYTSPRAQLTGIGALAWHGLRMLPNDPLVHVLVPHHVRRSSRGFVRVHRTHRLDPEVEAADGYTVCSVPRATADACRGLATLRDVRAVVAEAVQRGPTSVPALQQELAFAGSSRTALFRLALREVSAGVRSAPEAELRQLLALEGSLPTILWNPRLQATDGTPLPSPDGWITDLGIALEVDSREYHLSPEGWQRTMHRHNLLSSYGAQVLHFTPTEIRSRRRSVRGTVARACRERRAAGSAVAVRVVSAPGAQEGTPLTG